MWSCYVTLASVSTIIPAAAGSEELIHSILPGGVRWQDLHVKLQTPHTPPSHPPLAVRVQPTINGEGRVLMSRCREGREGGHMHSGTG